MCSVVKCGIVRIFGFSKGILGGLAAAILATVFAPSAEASLQLCNETSYMLEAAVAHKPSNKWKVEGWWSLQPGTCTVAIKESLRKRDYYTFAKSIPGHVGGVKAWGGRYSFCTGIGTFSLDNPPNCEQSGLQLRGFSRIETGGAKAWTNTFSENSEFNKKTSRVAGVQRLLRDIGYERVNIDGYVGRRTRLAITKFKKENNLPAGDALTDELYDTLARAANNKVQQAGLELCNSTQFDLFAAIADNVTEGTTWMSRGWYQIGKGQCTRVIKDPLTSSSYYAFAEVELANGEYYSWGGEKDFCVNDIRFAIDNEEPCTRRGYDSRSFVKVDAGGKAHTKFHFTMENLFEPEPVSSEESEDDTVSEDETQAGSEAEVQGSE